MPHKYWYCGTFDFKKVSKTGLYSILSIQATVHPLKFSQCFFMVIVHSLPPSGVFTLFCGFHACVLLI